MKELKLTLKGRILNCYKSKIKLNPKGFTLLEILLVLFIMSMLAAMVVPALGKMNDSERIKRTKKIIDEIETAVLGPKNIFDEKGARVIKGFVGDMKRWPELWEPTPEIKENFEGTGWDDPPHMSPGLGQYSGDDENGLPLYKMSCNKVFFRPSGKFKGKKWKWQRPFRRLHNHRENHDHVGGPETENEGQPRGLWTKYVEDYPYDKGPNEYLDHKGFILSKNWKGPYLKRPCDNNNQDSLHYAENNYDYSELEPKWHSHSNCETWEDGCYFPSGGELGENFDEKENFRLLNTDEKLEDAWGRALRFFITDDPDEEGETIFWIISEGPDYEGIYPTKGDYSSDNGWTIDETDTMGNNYNPNLPENKDNIVRKLKSSCFKVFFEEKKYEKKEQTKIIIEKIKQAVKGDSPCGSNTGFTSDMKRYPRLYNNDEEGSFGYKNSGNNEYNKGTPWDLFNKPGDIPEVKFGTGWRHNYLGLSLNHFDNQYIFDAWGNKIICFHDREHNSFMILSSGADGQYCFYNESLPEENINIATYNSELENNRDNIFSIIEDNDWLPGYLNISKITISNYGLSESVNVKARLFGIYDSESVLCYFFKDADHPDDLISTIPAFEYNDITEKKIVTGSRYLILWDDTDGNNFPDNGEKGRVFIYNVFPKSEKIIKESINVDYILDFQQVFN